jgi:hypothetical protein
VLALSARNTIGTGGRQRTATAGAASAAPPNRSGPISRGSYTDSDAVAFSGSVAP